MSTFLASFAKLASKVLKERCVFPMSFGRIRSSRTAPAMRSVQMYLRLRGYVTDSFSRRRGISSRFLYMNNASSRKVDILLYSKIKFLNSFLLPNRLLGNELTSRKVEAEESRKEICNKHIIILMLIMTNFNTFLTVLIVETDF